jgi:hypothetical protein
MASYMVSQLLGERSDFILRKLDQLIMIVLGLICKSFNLCYELSLTWSLGGMHGFFFSEKFLIVDVVCEWLLYYLLWRDVCNWTITGGWLSNTANKFYNW